ncbi:MAG: hypothetical protein IH988_02680, partial [Planctomycetes bacterium]|nr:hypothetical protein [Planctomycetota bacterium]
GRVIETEERGNIRHLSVASLTEVAAAKPDALTDETILNLLYSSGPQNFALTRTISKFFAAAAQSPAIRERMSEAYAVLVSEIPLLFEVLESAGFDGDFIEYPARQDEVEHFDWLPPIEGMSRLRSHHELDSITVYAHLLGQPGDMPLIRFASDPGARRRMRLPNPQPPRIALQARA